jgi:hypothetical protein
MVRLLELEELPIRVTARGEWLHGTTPLHPRVAELFQRNVVPRADGTYVVKLGRNEQVLEVHDTPYAVRRCDPVVRGDRLESIGIVVSDGRSDEVRGATLMQAADNTFYCRIARGDLWVPCRFTPGQYHALALVAEPELDGSTPMLVMGGRRFAIGPFVPAPLMELPS